MKESSLGACRARKPEAQTSVIIIHLSVSEQKLSRLLAPGNSIRRGSFCLMTLGVATVVGAGLTRTIAEDRR